MAAKRGGAFLSCPETSGWGDRGYSTPPGVRHVVEGGGDLVVRVNRQALPLFDTQGKRLDVVRLGRKLGPSQCREWAASVPGGKSQPIAGRLIIVRRSKQAAAQALKRLKRKAIKRQRPATARSLEAAQFFFVWTTLPLSWSCQGVLDLYRSRWPIELACKRMKSIMGLGHLPKTDPASCRAWIHGKFFTSLLVERMIGAARKISPWGYELEPAPE
ncbi:MAG: transposase [Terriglobia bacterium]